LILFLALSCIGVAVAGISAFVIFWPLSLVHLRDRHPDARAALGESAFLSPKALTWLLSGRYREITDRQFTGLATPARVSLICILASLVLSGALWLTSLLT